ncbi:MAG: hypothetical protein JXA52_05580, partial [Planctomycetes bacterium]|nr:hypothetical protein [Planctomycetota bacterium]
MAVQETTSIRPRLFSRNYIDWLDARLNPVFVKDIRCWLRSKRFLIIFFLGMSASLAVTLTTIIIAGTSKSVIGGEMYAILIGFLGFLLGGVVPYLIQDKFATELTNGSTELAMISRLTVGKLVRGKMLSGAAAALLFFAAIGPSLMIAYMLGGVDILAVVYTVAALLFLSSVITLIAILLVSLGSKKRLKLLNIIFCLACGGFLSSFLPAIVELSRSQSIFTDKEFWFGNAYVLVHLIPCVLFFYFVAVSRLSFQAENRDTRPRVMLTIFMLITFLSFISMPMVGSLVGFSIGLSKNEALLVAVHFALIIFGAGSLFLMNTPATPSPRTISAWPRWRLYSLVYYPGTGRLYAYLLAHFLFLLTAAACCAFWSAKYFYAATGTVICVFATLGAVTFIYNSLMHYLEDKKLALPRGLTIICILAIWNIMVVAIYIISISIYHIRSSDWALLCCPLTAIGYLHKSY